MVTALGHDDLRLLWRWAALLLRLTDLATVFSALLGALLTPLLATFRAAVVAAAVVRTPVIGAIFGLAIAGVVAWSVAASVTTAIAVAIAVGANRDGHRNRDGVGLAVAVAGLDVARLGVSWVKVAW